MKSLTTKILVGVMSLLVLATVGSQIYYRVNDKHDTEEAVLCNINENIPFKGVIVRDEKVVTYSGSGVLDYLYPDGSKISVNSPIAEVYSSEEAISAKRKSERINEQISDLERAQNPGTTNYVQPETLKTKIDNEYRQLLTYSQKGDYSSLHKTKSDMSVVMNIYNIITDTSENYNDKISALQSQSAQLDKQSVMIDTVNAAETGYFVSYCDGYEDKLTLDSIDSLSQQDIQEITDAENEQSVPTGAIGKMFDDYSCRIIGVVDADKRIIEGDTLQIMFSTSNNIYDVDVESVKPAEDEDKCIIVLSCDRLDDVLVKSRVQSIELIFEEYQGIKVPRKAIRFQGEQKGVYVILGNEITFKKIDVIYEGDDFVVSKNTSDEEYLLLYDQILLEVVSNKDVSDSDESS